MRARQIGERDGMIAVGQLEDQAAAPGPADRLDLDSGGGGPPSRPWISRSQSDWPRWPWRSPIATMTSPEPLKPMPTAFFQSWIRPTPPIAGVGNMAWLDPSSALVSL